MKKKAAEAPVICVVGLKIYSFFYTQDSIFYQIFKQKGDNLKMGLWVIGSPWAHFQIAPYN